MAEIVKVPVLGNVKQSWLYAGGAAVAGIAAYAWWTSAGEQVEEIGVELPAVDYVPPTVVDSGISVGGAQQGEPIARTNVEWATMFREQAAGVGASQTLAATALIKYLGKVPMTAAEASLVRAVVQILGQPPSGGPYTIVEAIPEPPPPHEPPPVQPPPPPAPPPPAPPPPAPAPVGQPPGDPASIGVLPIGPGRVGLAWPGVPGATVYRFRWETANEASGWAYTGETTVHVTWLFPRGTQFTARVQACNPYGCSPGLGHSNVAVAH